MSQKPLTELTVGYTSTRVTIGMSSRQTYRLTRRGSPAYFLKVAASAPYDDLTEEQRILMWLKGRLPVPEVLGWQANPTTALLLTTAIPGADAASLAMLWGRSVWPDAEGKPLDIQERSQRLHEAMSNEALVRLLAYGLRRIHALPVDDCPFDRRLDREIAQAETNMRNGAVTGEMFDLHHRGRSASDLYEELLRTRPATEDIVFTHGDYCLPNVIIDGDHVSGFVDWGRAGVADRHKDLAIAVRSIGDNLGPGLSSLFFAEYGIAKPDAAKIAFYQLLDEFF